MGKKDSRTLADVLKSGDKKALDALRTRKSK